MLVLAPLSWISGVMLLLKVTEVGYRRVSMPDPTPRQLLSSVQKYKVSEWGGDKGNVKKIKTKRQQRLVQVHMH